ncbi:MAG: cadmium resistance transporter [Gammaproteobacteria bacterium]|nr:cadmium resistance transporter [Gammaproteobacteria bacterium]
MNSFLTDISIGTAVFASTNIDDLFLLAAYFANPQIRRRAIVAGQFLGIGALILASVLAAVFALALPEGWVALLGLVPLLLGVRALLALRSAEEESAEADNVQSNVRGWIAQALSIAGVTIANGGDNAGVYVPLFMNASESIVTYVLIFAVLTGVWCALGHALVNHRVLGSVIKRYGHLALPFVLMALGLYILSGALVLLS